MDIPPSPAAAPAGAPTSRVGELLHRITDDVRTLAHDEVELAGTELQRAAKAAAGEVAIVLIGAIVALIGIGMLCAAGVAAWAPVIPSLAWRLLVMAVVYLIVGGAVAGVFARRLSHDARPDLKVPAYEAKRTVAGVKEALQEHNLQPG